MMTVTEHCRSCGYAFFELKPVFQLAPQFIATYFVGKDPVPTTKRFPLDVYECPECKLVQLGHTVDRELLFRNYWYRSSISNTMRDHLKQLAEEATKYADLKPGDLVVDIGANDGTLLGYFSQEQTRIAYEPSQLADEIPRGILVRKEFFPEERYPWPKAKLITAIAMFYDLDDPKSFLLNAKQNLREDGLICIEVADWPRLMKMGAFDTICHEHLTYFSLESLNSLAISCGLEMVEFSRNSLNGASLRVYLASAAEREGLGLELDGHPEIDHERATTPSWEEFSQRAKQACEETYEYLVQQQAARRQGCLLGASTKGNVFLQATGVHAGLVNFIEDRDKSKIGLETLGTGIRIDWEGSSNVLPWHTMFKLVLPWHFLPEIVQREEQYLLGGGELIAALPSFRKINIANWEVEIENFKREVGA